MVGKCPTCAAKGLDKAAHRIEEPAHAQAFHSLRELRGMRDELSASAIRQAHRHRGNLPRLRRAYGNRDHARGPWKLCPNFNCPGKEREAAEKAAKAEAKKAEKAEKAAKPAAKKAPAKKAVAKKTTTKKAATKE